MATNTKLTQLLQGRQVDSVRQRGADLDIDFTDGSTLSLSLGTPDKSIKLQSKNDKEEYSG